MDLLPNLGDVDRRKVEGLQAALKRDDARLEAIAILRSLIDAIVLYPDDKPGTMRIELCGQLAGILTLENGKETPAANCTLTMVAGARCHLYRTRTKWRKAPLFGVSSSRK